MAPKDDEELLRSLARNTANWLTSQAAHGNLSKAKGHWPADVPFPAPPLAPPPTDIAASVGIAATLAGQGHVPDGGGEPLISKADSKEMLLRTQLCRDFLQGRCDRMNCKFIHCEDHLSKGKILRSKTPCPFFLKGTCEKGGFCKWSHERPGDDPPPKRSRWGPPNPEVPLCPDVGGDEAVEGAEDGKTAPRSCKGEEPMGMYKRAEMELLEASVNYGYEAGDKDKTNNVFEMLRVQSDVVGFVIGQGGSNVMLIQKESGATVKIGKLDIDGERNILIMGEQGAREHARAKILQCVEESKTKGTNKKAEQSMHVPSKFIGSVIGKSGEVIKNISNTYRVHIEVEKEISTLHPDSELTTLKGESALRLVRILGHEQDVMFAKEHIEGLLLVLYRKHGVYNAELEEKLAHKSNLPSIVPLPLPTNASLLPLPGPPAGPPPPPLPTPPPGAPLGPPPYPPSSVAAMVPMQSAPPPAMPAPPPAPPPAFPPIPPTGAAPTLNGLPAAANPAWEQSLPDAVLATATAQLEAAAGCPKELMTAAPLQSPQENVAVDMNNRGLPGLTVGSVHDAGCQSHVDSALEPSDWAALKDLAAYFARDPLCVAYYRTLRSCCYINAGA